MLTIKNATLVASTISIMTLSWGAIAQTGTVDAGAVSASNSNSGAMASTSSTGGAGIANVVLNMGQPAETKVTQDVHQDIKTVGTPGALSLATAFSQYNCANQAGVNAGFMGGAFSAGGPIESDPCNARANAAALLSISSMVGDSPLKSQLVEAAIRLVGGSTDATAMALQQSKVSWFTITQATRPQPVNPGGYAGYQGQDPLVLRRLGAPSAVWSNR